MSFSIRTATIAELPIISELAYAIWPRVYGALLSKEQIAYMLSQMYAVGVLRKQHQLGQLFLLAIHDGVPAGFAAFEPNAAGPGIAKLHKLYLNPDRQGNGYGQRMIRDVEERAAALAQHSIQLNVNRGNKALDFYVHMGYECLQEMDIAIGKGFFMNDYLMQKKIGPMLQP